MFLVDGMDYLTALAKPDLSGHLDYTDRNIVEKLFQTFTRWIERFHETWNDSQPSAERWLIAYAYHYNHLRITKRLTINRRSKLPASVNSALDVATTNNWLRQFGWVWNVCLN